MQLLSGRQSNTNKHDTHRDTNTHTHGLDYTITWHTHTVRHRGAHTRATFVRSNPKSAHRQSASSKAFEYQSISYIYIHTYIHIFLSALRTHFLLPCLRAPRSWHFNTNMRFPAKRTNKTRQLQKRTSQSIVKLAPYHEYIFSFLSLLLIFSLLFLLLLKFYVLHARGISFAPTCAPFAKRTIKTQQL